MDKVEYSRETNRSDRLAARLALNEKASARDFQAWVQTHIEVREGDDVLDVACGTGAQTRRFLDRVGRSGTVSAIDASATSIQQLKDAGTAPNLTAVTGDMMDLATIIARDLPRQRFDCISCTYAIYY